MKVGYSKQVLREMCNQKCKLKDRGMGDRLKGELGRELLPVSWFEVRGH